MASRPKFSQAYIDSVRAVAWRKAAGEDVAAPPPPHTSNGGRSPWRKGAAILPNLLRRDSISQRQREEADVEAAIVGETDKNMRKRQQRRMR